MCLKHMSQENLTHAKTSTTIKTPGQMCSRHVSRKNLTQAKTNLPRWRLWVRYARDICVEKIRPIPRWIYHDRDSKSNAPKAMWARKAQPLPREIYYGGNILSTYLKQIRKTWPIRWDFKCSYVEWTRRCALNPSLKSLEVCLWGRQMIKKILVTNSISPASCHRGTNVEDESRIHYIPLHSTR